MLLLPLPSPPPQELGPWDPSLGRTCPGPTLGEGPGLPCLCIPCLWLQRVSTRGSQRQTPLSCLLGMHSTPSCLPCPRVHCSPFPSPMRMAHRGPARGGHDASSALSVLISLPGHGLGQVETEVTALWSARKKAEAILNFSPRDQSPWETLGPHPSCSVEKAQRAAVKCSRSGSPLSAPGSGKTFGTCNHPGTPGSVATLPSFPQGHPLLPTVLRGYQAGEHACAIPG